MNICYKQTYTPFSSDPGVPVLIPKTAWTICAYPAKIYFDNLLNISSDKPLIVSMDISGPVKNFTVFQELLRNRIHVSGFSSKGFFSYFIHSMEQQIFLTLNKCPDCGIAICLSGEKCVLQKKQSIKISAVGVFAHESKERIHCGSFKKLQWSRVQQRESLREFLPLWFEIGKSIPFVDENRSIFSQALKRCLQAVVEKKCDQIGRCFQELFRIGFQGLYVPRYSNIDDFGMQEEGFCGDIKNTDRLAILGFGAMLIRRLFVDSDDHEIRILPCLPKELHAGRFVNISLTDSLIADLEWSKKSIKRMILHSKCDQSVKLGFQPAIQSFRFSCKTKASSNIRVDAGSSLHLKGRASYLIDCFQK